MTNKLDEIHDIPLFFIKNSRLSVQPKIFDESFRKSKLLPNHRLLHLQLLTKHLVFLLQFFPVKLV